MAVKDKDRSQADRQRPERPDIGPGHDKAAGKSSDPRGENAAAGDPSDPRGQLGAAEQQAGGLYNPGGDKGAQAAEPGAIKENEQAASEGSLYNPGSQKGGRGKKQAKGFVRRNKRKFVAGGVAGGGLVASIIGAFILFIPLKIEHIVSNLQNHFYAASDQATENETQNLFKGYFINHVFGAYKNCGTTVSKNCKVSIANPGSNPVSNLYKNWSQARLENTLADTYHIEFKLTGVGGGKTWHLIAPGTPAAGDPLGTNPSTGFDKEFKRADRGTMRNAVKEAMQNETKYKEIKYRYQVGKLLEQKYGIKRCIVFCGVRDTFAEHVDSKKLAAQIFLTQRVLIPRTESFGIVIECLLSTSCNPAETSPTTSDESISEASGTPENSEVDSANRTTLTKLAENYGLTDKATVDKMISDYKTISEGGGFQKYFVDKALEKFGQEEFSEPINKLGPVVSGTVLAAKIVTALKDAGPKIRKLTYVTNSSAAIGVWSMARTYADEIHTGNVDPTEVGSFIDSFGPGNLGNASDPELGGTATAEDTPLYKNLLDDGTTASPADSSDYLCKDGKPVPAGQLVCSEEVLGQGSGAADAVNSFLTTAPISYITGIAGFINGLANTISNWGSHIPGVGLVGDAVSAAIQAIPGFSSIENTLNGLVGGLVKDLIPNPFGSNMSGGRNFDMAAAGANVSGNDSCSQVGCQTVPAATVQGIIQGQDADARQQFDSESFFARMFDTNSNYSLVSKLAMATPLNLEASAQTDFASFVSHPFSIFTNSFGSLFSTRNALADTSTGSVDPFNIGTVAFPANKIPADPETAWTADKCDDTSSNGPVAKWQADSADPDGSKKNENPADGMPMHTDVEPCLLIQNSVGAAGAKYDSSLLTPAEQQEAQGQQASDTPTTAAGATIDMATLFDDSTNVACAPNTTDLGIQDGYTGGKKVPIRICAVSNLPSTGEESNGGYGVSGANGKAVVNSRVSGAVYAMVAAAKQDGVTLTAISSFRSMAHQQALCPCDGVTVAQPGYSNHQMGIAIDFGGGLPSTPGPIAGNQFWTWLTANADKFGYKNYPREAWHWSPTGS